MSLIQMGNIYKYKGIPFHASVARDLILTLFSGAEPLKTRVIREVVIQRHEELEGLPAIGNPNWVVKKALERLKRNGHAENVSRGYWKINEDAIQPETDILEELKARDARIERLEVALLFALSLKLGTSGQTTPEAYLRGIDNHVPETTEKLIKEYGTAEKVIEQLPQLLEEKMHSPKAGPLLIGIRG